MGGASIRQARAALLLALQRLQAGDTFNVIQFNSRTESLFDRPEAVSPQTLRSANAYIQRLHAGGGTVMLPALEQSLSSSTKDYDVRQVIFLTDGSVGNEDALFESIRRHIGDTRLFTVGIGSAPNAHFMRRASRFGRGTYTYIGDVNEVGERMQALFAKLESAVMTGIRVQGAGQAEMWPQAIPDLYSGEPLMFTLRAGELPGSLNVSGEIAGQPWSSELVLDGGQDHPGVARLWARQKIAALMDQRGSGNEAEQIRRSIIELALEHHLVSKYTSLVAVDVTPARVREALLKSLPVPVNLPHGWDYDKVFGKLPQTATPATWNMLAGLLCLLTGLVLLRGRRHV
jgi:Ca-activated chloride channel family protein